MFGPPGFSAIIAGMTYGLRLALRQVDPADTDAHPNGPAAIAQALWFRYLITALNGVLVLSFDQTAAILLFLLISVIDTFAYPVVSHGVLYRAGLGPRYPSFITAYTWVGNLRILLLMSVSLLTASFGTQELQIALFPFALWMIWASWSVATHSLKRGGWVGAGMVFLGLILEMLLGALIITFIHPNLGA